VKKFLYLRCTSCFLTVTILVYQTQLIKYEIQNRNSLQSVFGKKKLLHLLNENNKKEFIIAINMSYSWILKKTAHMVTYLLFQYTLNKSIFIIEVVLEEH
jgi:hypothetical protein